MEEGAHKGKNVWSATRASCRGPVHTPSPPLLSMCRGSSFLNSQVEPTTKVSRCTLDCLGGAFYREVSDPKCLCCSGSTSQSCLVYTARQWDRSAALSPYFPHLSWAPSLAKQRPESKAALPKDSAFLTWRANHLKSKDIGPCGQSGTWTLPCPLAGRTQVASTPSSKPQNIMRATKCQAHLVCYLTELPQQPYKEATTIISPILQTWKLRETHRGSWRCMEAQRD